MVECNLKWVINMGLDIYFYKVKNKEICETYLSTKKEYDRFYNRLEEKYRNELKAAYKKWEDWFNAENERINALPENASEDEREYDRKTEPCYDVSDFITDEIEKTEWQALSTKYNLARSEMHIDYGEDIDELYMRKQNWMVHFVQERHPERLVHDKDYGDILESAAAVLDRIDIKELIHRMNKILGNSEKLKNYEETTGRPESIDGMFRTIDAVEWYEHWKAPETMVELAEIYLPTMSRFFFGSTEYDWYYFDSLRLYRDRFKKWLDESEPDEVLFYEESW